MIRWSTIVLAALLASGAAWSDEAKPADRLSDVRFLVGRWSGTSDGQAGRGSVSRVYEPILNGRYIHERNRSDYPAQPANPKGEVHEHWSFLSYDKIRQTVVLRQFHVEGFVNTYRLLPRSATDKRLVFESDQIENLPADWRARETYDLISQDEFTETFELAAPGKPFEEYGKARLTRVP
jgi:nitrobindin-like protein